MGQSLQPEKPKVNEGQSPLIQEDFFLFNNDQEHPIAPLTPKSLTNSPLMPAEPRPALYDSFDSDDEETVYDTFGFFPSYSSIERRPQNSTTEK